MGDVINFTGFGRGDAPKKHGVAVFYSCAKCDTTDFALCVDGTVFCNTCDHNIPGLTVVEVDDDQGH